MAPPAATFSGKLKYYKAKKEVCLARVFEAVVGFLRRLVCKHVILMLIQ